MHKLDVILAIRGLYGIGLKEAKDLTDAAEAAGVGYVFYRQGTDILMDPEKRHTFFENVRALAMLRGYIHI